MCITLSSSKGGGGGFHHTFWQDLQQRYYELEGSKRTGKRWSIALKKFLWGFLKLLWGGRNEHKHKQINHCIAREQQIGDKSISGLYRRLEDSPGREDEYLCQLPLDILLLISWAYKKEWISQARAIDQRLRDKLRTADTCHLNNENQRRAKSLRAGRSRAMRDRLAQAMARLLNGSRG